MHRGTSCLRAPAVDSSRLTRHAHLRIDEAHFTLLVIFFRVMFEFDGGYPFAEHTPHFNQVVLLTSTNEQQLCVLLASPGPHTRRAKWLRFTLTLCHGLRSNLETGIEQILSRWKLLPFRPKVGGNVGAGPYDGLGGV